MTNTPYRYGWSRQLFYEFLIHQAIDFDISTFLVKQICFDYDWNPVADYDGCTLVQDKFHPFLPCFIHDYRWRTGQGGLDSDLEFKINLQKSGMSKFESWKWFFGVRLGWLFYYKWKYAKRNSRNS